MCYIKYRETLKDGKGFSIDTDEWNMEIVDNIYGNDYGRKIIN